MFHCNLTTPMATYNYHVQGNAGLSRNMTGLSLPYVEQLAKPDYGIVPRVIERYFLGTLGLNAELAKAEFDEIKASWGNICKTSWGDQLAHMYRSIELALEAQGSIRVVETSLHTYKGTIIYGGMYEFHTRDKIYKAVPHAELIVELAASNPHVSSLTFIYDSIAYPDATTRLNMTNAARSIRDVNRELTTRGFLQAREEEIIRKAHLLSFPGQSDYFAVTAYNIEKVFQAMGNATISEADFPLHPDAVTSTKRDERLLSAFGSEVPSFRVPGGKKMSLSGNFAVKMREANGKMELKDVHAIGAILVPLAKGYQDYIAMKNDQEILNPFGSRLANQASSSSIVKKWEKDTCTTVVAALRSAVGASANVPANENKKRKADDDEIDDRYHRVDAFDFLDI